MTQKRKFDTHDGQAHNKRLRNDGRPQEPLAQMSSHPLSQQRAPKSLPPLPPISTDMSKAVFTHQSMVTNKDNTHQSASYERLEFLGDAYIEVMASRLIWHTFKDLPAGRLSQIRELLVKNETLGEIAVNYGLDKQIAVAADLRLNTKMWTKIKGDLIEAYVAAVVLADNEMGGTGFVAAENWLHQLWMPKLEGIMNEKVPNLNAKDALSRKVLSRESKLEYLEERPMKQLKGGQQTYFIGAFLTGWGYMKKLLGSGQGLNKTRAGNMAAEDALQNPLVEKIAKMKRESNEMATAQEDDRAGDKHVTQESMTRGRELVEKKRSMFMSTEFG